VAQIRAADGAAEPHGEIALVPAVLKLTGRRLGTPFTRDDGGG
jgi:hypothetical protein